MASSASNNEHRAIPLVYKNEEGEFLTNLDEIEQILTDPAVKDLKVAIISVAGKYRRGKSFLLNFFLRYLYANSIDKQGDEWIGFDNEELKGFAWKLQSERLTTGILIWSKIFTIEVENETIAIILMDTQGTFDDEHIMEEHTKILAMTTLLSSFEIYNVTRDIEEDDLQNLALFTTYAEKFYKKSDIKMGQKLHFLVRDWIYRDECPLGFEGGEKQLAKKLDITNRKPEFVRVRKALRSSYEKVSCYLLPPPGTNILMDSNWKGQLSALDKIFVEHLKIYVPYIFSEDNIQPKTLNGTAIKVSDFIRLIKNYANLFAKGETNGVRMMDIYEMYAHVSFGLARDQAFELYKHKMLADSNIYETIGSFDSHHKISKKEAMELFRRTAISGSDDIKENHALILDQDIESAYSSFTTKLSEITIFQWIGSVVGGFLGALSGACAPALGMDAIGAGVIVVTSTGIAGAVVGIIALGVAGAIFARKMFLRTRYGILKQKIFNDWMKFTRNPDNGRF